jgi:hypothetical protein
LAHPIDTKYFDRTVHQAITLPNMFLKNYRKWAKRLPWGRQKFTKIEPPLLCLDVKFKLKKSQRVQAGSTRAGLETRQWLTWALPQALPSTDLTD